MINEPKKLIKVTSRGMVTTSRGRCRSPLGPYKETVPQILQMLTRDRAEIVELLDDGKEVSLSITNFDQKNVDTPVPTATEVKKSVESKQTATETNDDNESARQMTRKERKKLQLEQKKKETSNDKKINSEATNIEVITKDKVDESTESTKEETSTDNTKIDVPVEEPTDAEIPSDAIEA